MNKQAIVDFDPYDIYEARKLVEWTLGHCVSLANHHTCLCSVNINIHQGVDTLIIISVHYPLTQAYHAQYLNINMTQPDFMDTIMDSVKSSIQLVQPQLTYPAYPCCGQAKHNVPACPSTSLDNTI